VDSFKLSFDIPVSEAKIVHGKNSLFLGSCFSDEIAAKAKYYGFEVSSNPFGTIFHPTVLSEFLNTTLQLSNDVESIVSRQDLFFSWNASSSVYGFSSLELSTILAKRRKDWLEKLQVADFLFVTFGTAWAYRNNNSAKIVANCHKFPASHFTKELSEQTSLVAEWKETLQLLKRFNPNLKVVFTVSPVRHIKDGLIENNRSKAVLLDLVRRLEAEVSCGYFPSYEIIMDELRDYRFFKLDRIHPTEEAIHYVWKRFSSVYFSPETIRLTQEVEKLRLSEAHRSMFSMSREFALHQQKTAEKRKQLLMEFPEISLD
jgi:hypothetical protein